MKIRNGCNVGFVALVLAAAGSPVLVAVERPQELEEEPHRLETTASQEDTASQAPSGDKQIAIVEAIPKELNPDGPGIEEVPIDAVPQDSIPYLGIGSTPIDEALAEHLGVERGVLVQQVHQGSGAAKAGLLKNDILLSFDGKEIASPLDLRDAVQNCAVGDEVTVSLIRKGQRQEEKVVLEQRPEGLPGVPRGMRGLGRLQQVWPGLGELPAEAQEQIERLRNMMDEDFNGFGLGLKLNELLDGALPEGEGPVDLDMDTSSSVTWSDGEGTITMKMKNGQTEVRVLDQQGQVVYEGPWETPQDKAAVEPKVRDRIEKMGVRAQGNQLKFWMEGLPRGR